jgi:hypothetical protein
MGVRDHDGMRAETRDAIRSVLAAVDHHPAAAMSHQQCGMEPMARRPRIDVTPRAEEGERHAARGQRAVARSAVCSRRGRRVVARLYEWVG